jgi:hypothetical protein
LHGCEDVRKDGAKKVERKSGFSSVFSNDKVGNIILSTFFFLPTVTILVDFLLAHMTVAILAGMLPGCRQT